MLCIVCKYEGQFGLIQLTSNDGYSLLVGYMPHPTGHVGSIDLLICPKCGVIYSNMRNAIKIPGNTCDMCSFYRLANGWCTKHGLYRSACGEDACNDFISVPPFLAKLKQ